MKLHYIFETAVFIQLLNKQGGNGIRFSIVYETGKEEKQVVQEWTKTESSRLMRGAGRHLV